MMGMVRTLHKNLGHPSRRALARALRLRGAPKAVISAAKRLKCSVCDALKSPRTRRSAALPRARYFLDRVHIDLLQIEGADRRRHWILNGIDGATRYCFQVLLQDRRRGP